MLLWQNKVLFLIFHATLPGKVNNLKFKNLKFKILNLTSCVKELHHSNSYKLCVYITSLNSQVTNPPQGHFLTVGKFVFKNPCNLKYKLPT